MTALEGCLIAIGIIAIAISYFISEKSAEERMKKAVDELVLGEETKRTLINQAKNTVEDVLNGMSEEIAGKAEIQLEKLSNEKVMMVHEYSDTVLEEIGKNHQEVMFLYSMLDDKDRDVKNTVREAQKVVKSMREWNQRQEYIMEQSEARRQYLETDSLEVSRGLGQAIDRSSGQNFEEDLEQNVEERFEENQETRGRSERRSERISEKGGERNSERSRRKRSKKRNREKKMETIEVPQNVEEYFIENVENEYTVEIEEKNFLSKNEDKRDQIIGLYRQGNSKLEIAKELKLSMGEVNLVIDLYYTPEERRGNME